MAPSRIFFVSSSSSLSLSSLGELLELAWKCVSFFLPPLSLAAPKQPIVSRTALERPLVGCQFRLGMHSIGSAQEGEEEEEEEEAERKKGGNKLASKSSFDSSLSLECKAKTTTTKVC